MSPYEPRTEGLNTQPAPPSVVETLKPRTYTTQPGESVAGIAMRQCGDEEQWRHILAYNPEFWGLLPCEYFPVGTVLTLPPSAALSPHATAGGDAVDVFFDEVKAELRRARAKFPGDRIMTIALAEEFGELCKAVLEECAANVRKEAVQTAVMCARVVLDGDGSVNEWRNGKGLDPLTDAAIAANQARKGE